MREKRRTERKQTDNFIGVYHRETSEYVGRVLNMSTKGMMILAVRWMNINTNYEFRIDLPKPIAGKHHLIFDATCVWCRKSEDSKDACNAGFQITDIDFEEIKTIQYLLHDALFYDTKEQPRVTVVEKSS